MLCDVPIDKPLMHMFGNVIVSNESYHINDCLFDTGASMENYISQSYVDKHIDVFSEFIMDHKSVVRLGDSVTTVDINQIVTLTVTFLDNNSITHEAILNFSIMHIVHIDMIIGVNSILFSLFDLFIDMLKVARNNIVNIKKISSGKNDYNHSVDLSVLNNEHVVCTSHDIPDHPDYIYCEPTWSVARS